MSNHADELATVIEPWCTVHAISSGDEATMVALRTAFAANKGRMRGVAARGAFDEIMERVASPVGVTFRPDTVNGIKGWWCTPPNVGSGDALLHIHGGWYNWGTAKAFRHLAGQIATRAGVEAFVPEYRLAPEHPFPAALHDVQACYQGLLALRSGRIAFTGDSAGGGLVLALLSLLVEQASPQALPVGAAVLSPVTDLSLAGSSWESRADADPYFTREQAVELVSSYLGDRDPTDPLASPLHSQMAGLPPLRVHVGNDEVLLDDSKRYVAQAVAAGVDARLDIWEGVAHGFASGVGRLSAANQALNAVGLFLKERLTDSRIRL